MWVEHVGLGIVTLNELLLVEMLLAVASGVEHLSTAVVLLGMMGKPVFAANQRLLLRLHCMPLVLHLIKAKLFIGWSCFRALRSQTGVHGIRDLKLLNSVLGKAAVDCVRIHVRVSQVV